MPEPQRSTVASRGTFSNTSTHRSKGGHGTLKNLLGALNQNFSVAKFYLYNMSVGLRHCCIQSPSSAGIVPAQEHYHQDFLPHLRHGSERPYGLSQFCSAQLLRHRDVSHHCPIMC
jgi:hypothetical protein